MIADGGVTALLGREGELRTLSSALASARDGAAQVLLIEGEPGIGKTRLLDAADELALSAGFQVFRGVCDAESGPRPFAGLVGAFAIAPDAADPGRAAIAALLDGDAVGEGVASTPGPQYRVVEAFAGLVEKRAVGTPVLLILDDLQWADSSTLISLRAIARRTMALPVAIVAACRAGHDVADLHRVTDDLIRGGARRIEVGPLADGDVDALVADLLDSQPPGDLLARVRGANGNPLFVIEYVRAVRDAPPGETASMTPREFRVTVLRRLATLPELTQDVLRLASVLGRSFSPADLAILGDRSMASLTAPLHAAVVAGILEDRPARLAFRHGLIRDAIYEHIPEAVRRQLHREAARALAGASDARTVAHHFILAANGEDVEALEWIQRAARETAPRAPGAAVELLERAASLLGPASPARDAVHADLAMALAWSGRLAEAEALASEVVGRQPDPKLAGALRCGLVYALTWQGRPIEALRHVDAVADEQLDEWDALLLRAEAAVARMWAFDLKAADAEAARVAEQAQRTGHELALCHALTVQALAATFADPHRAVALGRQAVQIANRSPSGEAHLAHPRWFPVMPMLFLDQIDEAGEMLDTGLRIAESLGLAWSLPLYHAFLGTKGFITGDWDDALVEFDAAKSAADEAGLHVGIMAAASAWSAAIQVHRGDLEGAERTLAAALVRLAETGPQLGMGPFNFARALVLEARDRPDDALSLLQGALDMFRAGAPVPDPSSAALVVTDPWSAMAMVRLCVQTGDVERGRALLPSIDHQAQVTGTPFMRGQALRCRGLLDQDADALVSAIALYRQSPRPHELACVCEDAARLLAVAGRVDEAVPLWIESVELSERLGAERDAARVRAQLRASGVKRGTRRPNVRATTGWESLTDAEVKVVALVVQGMSNPEVAERLFISRHTVESHLKNVYRKLNLRSRSELVAAARQHPPG